MALFADHHVVEAGGVHEETLEPRGVGLMLCFDLLLFLLLAVFMHS